MDRHGAVEIGLGRPHLHRDADELNHLAGIRADDVATDDLLAVPIDHELHEGSGRAPREGRTHRPETGLVDIDSRASHARLRLGQADDTDLRLREHSRRHVTVIDPRRLAAEDAVGKSVPLANGNGSQIHAIRHIADGVDVRHGRLRIVVDHDRTFAHGHARRLEAEIMHMRVAADREHDLIRRDTVAARKLREKPLRAFRDFRHGFAENNLDAAIFHFRVKMRAQIVVEAAQDFLAAINECDLRAEAGENPGELDADIAAALNDDTRWQRFEMKRLVGRDDMLDARNGFAVVGRSTGRDEDIRGADRFSGRECDGVAVDDSRSRLEATHLGPLECRDIGRFEPVDLAIFVGDQRRPVEFRLSDGPAETGRILEVVRKARGIDEEFFGHATANDAGAAEAVFFRDGDLDTILRRGDARGAYTPEPAPMTNRSTSFSGITIPVLVAALTAAVDVSSWAGLSCGAA